MKRSFVCLLVCIFVFFSVSAFSESVPYHVNLEKGMPIYAGPGAAYEYKQDVIYTGVYTIVQEAIGDDFYLWGKLKSGAGWVRLSEEPVRKESPMVPYTIKISAWAEIFKGPGYDYAYSKPVGVDGVYTIVEEMTDEEGNLWGRLKSGAGWVDITRIWRPETRPVIVSFADNALLESGKYHFHPADSSEYAVKIAFRVQTFIRNVRLSELSWDEGYEPVETVLFGKRYLFNTLPLVAELEFSGDMTSYALDFTDENGMDHRYLISISGRNGSLHVQEEAAW